MDWSAAYEGFAHNLSAQGMAIMQGHLTSARRVVLGLSVEGRTVHLPAEIRHCRPVGPGMVELGCRFEVPAPPLRQAAAGPDLGEVARVVEQIFSDLFQKTDMDLDRRQWNRVSFTQRLQIVRSTEKAPLVGYGRNLSHGGIGLITNRPLPEEEVVIILSTGHGTPVPVRARVVRCVKVTQGIFEVGAEFLGLEKARKARKGPSEKSGQPEV